MMIVQKCDDKPKEPHHLDGIKKLPRNLVLHQLSCILPSKRVGGHDKDTHHQIWRPLRKWEGREERGERSRGGLGGA